MGADMSLAVMPAIGKITLEERKKLMFDFIDKLTDKEVAELDWDEIVDGGYTFYIDEEEEEEFSVDTDLLANAGRLKQIAKEIITAFVETDGNRETSSFTLAGVDIMASGGMSWGDNPTESYNDIDKFSRLPIEIQEVGKFGWYDPIDVLLEFYKGQLPDKLVEELNQFKMALKV